MITLAARSPIQPGEEARVLDVGVTHPPQRVAAELGVQPHAEVICRRQATIRADGATAALLTSWFPAALAESAPDLLSKTPLPADVDGYRPVWGEDWISARPPSMDETRTFGIKRGSPVIVVHSRRYGASDTVIEYAELTARADARVAYRYQFATDIP